MRAALVLVLAGLAGVEAAADAPPSSLAQKIAAARDRMHARFTAAKSTELAIALGDLGRAHSEAQRIAVQDEPDFLLEWRPYLDDIRHAAGQVVASGDTVTAAKTMAQLGRACARCHEATGASIQFPKEPAPKETQALHTQMLGHQWAAARMWEGLIGPSNDRWRAGARELATSRLTLTAEGGQLGIADDAARTKLLANRALKLDDHNERATLYGDLLATCAHCHATIRDRVVPRPAR